MPFTGKEIKKQGLEQEVNFWWDISSYRKKSLSPKNPENKKSPYKFRGFRKNPQISKGPGSPGRKIPAQSHLWLETNKEPYFSRFFRKNPLQ